MAAALPGWQDERIAIEPLAMEHLDLIIALRNDPEVSRYIARDPFADRHEAVTFMQRVLADIHEGRGCNWVIRDLATGLAAGTAGVWRFDRTHDIGEVGYGILPAWWGQGLVRRALRPMFDYVFAEHRLHRLEANVDPRNSRSAGLLRHLGFRHEASLRENYKHHDEYLDSHIYGLLRTDWQSR